MSAAVLALGCASSPPLSEFPDAESIIERMHETYSCSRGISGEAKIDYFQDGRRVRGDVLYLAMLPSQVRFDAFSPFGVMLSTMTSDGDAFSLFDLREKVFLRGEASACNLARFTGVAVPPHALVQLLRGEAPVLVHERGAASLEWQGSWLGTGEYLVKVPSRHGATQELRLVPLGEDWNKPWRDQRVLVNSVEVVQAGYQLYRATLAEHETVYTAEPKKDPDGLGPDLLPSGPPCEARVPRRLRLEVNDGERDLVVHNRKIAHNPPLESDRFEQPIPGGVVVREARCTP